MAILVGDDGRRGYFAFERGRFGIGRPIAAGMNNAQGIVAPPDLPWDPRELVRACNLHVLALDQLVEGQRPLSRFVHRIEPSPMMDLHGGFDAYGERLRERGGSFSRVMHRYRKLQRDHMNVRFEYRGTADAALEALIKWKVEQYRRTARPNFFAPPWTTALLREFSRVGTSALHAVLSILWVGSRPVAVNFALGEGGYLAGWLTSYDPDFRRYSPGMVLLVLMAEAAAENHVERFELGRGRSEQKDRLKTGDTMLAEAQVVLPTPVGVGYRLVREPPRRLEHFVLDHERLRSTVRSGLHRFGSLRARYGQR